MLASTTTPPHHNNNNIITIIIIINNNNNNKRQKWKSRKSNNSEFNATHKAIINFSFSFLGGTRDLGNCPRNLGGPLSLFLGKRERERERE
jgi:hypothetical protein